MTMTWTLTQSRRCRCVDSLLSKAHLRYRLNGDCTVRQRVQGGGGRGNRHRAPPEFKDKVLGVLQGAGYAEARSAKLTQEDFFALLAAFNVAGIHFA